MRTIGRHHVEKDPHRGIDDAAHHEFVVAHQADGFAEGLTDFAHQYQAQFIHIGKMPVETGGNDAGGFRHFAQAQAAESSAAFHQMAGSVHQGVAGLLFLFGAGQHRKGVFLDKTATHSSKSALLASNDDRGTPKRGAGREGVLL
ncbi:hypothetical protein EMIT0P100_150055 [Pseudomonas sp. IT-P100]